MLYTSHNVLQAVDLESVNLT